MDTNNLSSRIKERRAVLGLTQQDVATKVGVSRVAVTKWENGDSQNIRLGNLLTLSKCLDCSVLWLISGKDTPATAPHAEASGGQLSPRIATIARALEHLPERKLRAIEALLSNH